MVKTIMQNRMNKTTIDRFIVNKVINKAFDFESVMFSLIEYF